MAEFLDTTAGFLTALSIICATIGGTLVWVRRRWQPWGHDLHAARDVLLGRDAVTDSITGAELSPKLPGIGERMLVQENTSALQAQALHKLTDAVAAVTNQNARIDNHEERLRVVERLVLCRDLHPPTPIDDDGQGGL